MFADAASPIGLAIAGRLAPVLKLNLPRAFDQCSNLTGFRAGLAAAADEAIARRPVPREPNVGCRLS
jgi:hypothetical protein